MGEKFRRLLKDLRMDGLTLGMKEEVGYGDWTYPASTSALIGPYM